MFVVQQGSGVVLQQGPQVPLSPAMNVRRRSLRNLGIAFTIGGLLMAGTGWTGYFLGIFAGLFCLAMGVVQVQRTNSEPSFILGIQPRGFGRRVTTNFSSQRSVCYVCTVVCFFSLLASILGTYHAFQLLAYWPSSYAHTDVAFSIICCIATLTMIVLSVLSANKCGEIHQEVVLFVQSGGFGQSGAPAAFGGLQQPMLGGGMVEMQHASQPIFLSPPVAYGQPVAAPPQYQPPPIHTQPPPCQQPTEPVPAVYGNTTSGVLGYAPAPPSRGPSRQQMSGGPPPTQLPTAKDVELVIE